MDHGNLSQNEPAIIEQHPTLPPGDEGKQRKILTGIIIAVVLVLVLLIGGVVVLALPTTDTPRIRDIFIILMAVESILLGMTLVILVVQLARLINLLENEIKPILASTNETVNNLRGTTTFLSDNLVQPVIKLNEYLAGLSQALKLVSLARKRPKSKEGE